MTPLYQLTPIALDDLDGIWSYIAAESSEAADRVESAILEACELLGHHPLLGSRRLHIASDTVRFWPVSRFRNYVVVYQTGTKPLQIVAVLHAKRNSSRIILERNRPELSVRSRF